MTSGTPSQEGSAEAGALWGGRFDSGMAPAMVPLNLSLDVDQRMWRQDLQGSRAWARALAGAGVLTEAEAAQLVDGLDAVGARIERDGFAGVPDEDIHSLVERWLTEEVGEVALKLHTGRSRNDQVATDLRLWTRDALTRLRGDLAQLGEALVTLAGRGLDLVMPGYTHLQQGQPVRAAHWALAHLWPVVRDIERIDAVLEAASVLPLGSGAVAGCPFPIDRERLAADLGFARISENSLDAISDRDFALDALYTGARVGLHMSRLAEDLVLFSSIEFGFVRLADGYSTGSSLMPQKRNPDVAELTRGRTGRLVGNLMGLMTLLKGLPTGYNRDLQEDKSLLFDTFDGLFEVLPALAGAVATAEFRPERIAERLDTQLIATDLADYLVRKGVPFRRSHEAIGVLVKRAEDRRCGLHELELAEFQAVNPLFADDVHDLFDWDRSADSRAVPGGAARTAIERQMAEANERLATLASRG
jgi:argininosuccinate lyase